MRKKLATARELFNNEFEKAVEQLQKFDKIDSDYCGYSYLKNVYNRCKFIIFETNKTVETTRSIKIIDNCTHEVRLFTYIWGMVYGFYQETTKERN